MLNDAIKLGDKINIVQTDVKAGITFQSKLLDIKEDGTFSIAMPMEKSQVVLLEKGSQFHLTFYTVKGLYSCDAVVIKRYKVQNIYVAELRTRTVPKKIQRREYFRFQCVIEMQYCILPFEEFEESLDRIYHSNATFGLTPQQEKIRAVERLKDFDVRDGKQRIEMKKAVITDISGGGLKFRTTEEINQKTDIYLIFSINQGLSNYHVFGDIISSEKVKVKTSIYEHRLKFTDISADEREQIIRYILNEERRIRQKEKGFC